MDSMERSMNHHINKNASGIGESFPIFLYRVEALNLFFLDFNLKENPLNQTSKTQTQRVNIKKKLNVDEDYMTILIKHLTKQTTYTSAVIFILNFKGNTCFVRSPVDLLISPLSNNKKILHLF